jgi:hypothetical protein
MSDYAMTSRKFKIFLEDYFIENNIQYSIIKTKSVFIRGVDINPDNMSDILAFKDALYREKEQKNKQQKNTK